MANELNGISVRRRGNTVFIPLPRTAWAEIAGGCSCCWCSADGKPAPAFWDTLAVVEDRAKSKSVGADCTWTCHAPEYQLGAQPKRDPDESNQAARLRAASRGDVVD